MNKYPHKLTYAVLTTIELGMHFGDTPVQAKTIALNQSIPSRFIEHILSALKQAGLVMSSRGAQGGYTLSKSPSDTSLDEIVQAVNGTAPSAMNGATNGHHDNLNTADLLLSGIWRRLQDAELAILRSISLQTLMEQYQELEDKHALMYHI